MVDFTPYLGWINVPDASNIPEGAKLLAASDLLRYENALVALAGELNGRLSSDGVNATIGGALAELSATYGPQVSAVQDLIGKIRTGAQNVTAAFITDSTGTYDQATWTSGVPAALAALFPTHSVVIHTWNYTSGTAWNAASTIATGTGPRTIHLWFGGAPGQNWQYFMDTARRAAFFGGIGSADAVFISLGHNDPAAADIPGLRPNIDRAIIHLERFRLLLPHAAFILVSQNPTTVAGKFAEGHADAYRRIAAQRGYGFIDCTRPFQNYAGPITDLVPDNNLHPTAAGYTLWRDRFLAEFVSQNTSRPIPQSLPSLSVAGKSIIPRVTLPMGANGWTLSNVTEASEAVIVDRRTATAKLTKTAGGSGAQVWRPLPDYVRGKSFYAVVHMYIPAASYANAGQIQVREGGTVKATAVLPTSIRDQWFDVAVSWDVPHTAAASPNGMRLYINVDGQGGSELPVIYVEDVDIFIGDYPLDAVYG